MWHIQSKTTYLRETGDRGRASQCIRTPFDSCSKKKNFKEVLCPINFHPICPVFIFCALSTTARIHSVPRVLIVQTHSADPGLFWYPDLRFINLGLFSQFLLGCQSSSLFSRGQLQRSDGPQRFGHDDICRQRRRRRQQLDVAS